MKECIQLDYRNLSLAAQVAKALASEVRLQILGVIESRPMNISEVAEKLSIPISTTAMHIRMLEEAGIVVTQSLPGLRGHQKVCGVRVERIEFTIHDHVDDHPQENFLVQEMPIGNYFDCQISPPCGIVSETGFISQEDDVSGFYSAQKHTAQLIWLGNGYLEYRFSNRQLKRISNLKRLEFSFELCSEAPAYNNTWKSDVTVWINKISVGTVHCAGDYGGRAGKLNPAWWSMDFTQYGALRTVMITDEMSYVDGEQSADVCLGDLGLDSGDYLTLRIGLDQASRYVGGLNLFGDKFGDYAQNLVMKIVY